jgi:enoyl-CoA hydratase
LSRAKELSLTGNFLNAETACAWGLVNRVVAPGELLAQAKALAADIAGIDPAMVQAYRSMIDDGFGLGLQDALTLEHVRSSLSNSRVNAEDVEKRRIDVMKRGRAAV